MADDDFVNIAASLVGIMLGYGIGLAIVYTKGVREPFYFYAWPSAVRYPVGLWVLAWLYILMNTLSGVLAGR